MPLFPEHSAAPAQNQRTRPESRSQDPPRGSASFDRSGRMELCRFEPEHGPYSDGDLVGSPRNGVSEIRANRERRVSGGSTCWSSTELTPKECLDTAFPTHEAASGHVCGLHGSSSPFSSKGHDHSTFDPNATPASWTSQPGAGTDPDRWAPPHRREARSPQGAGVEPALHIG